MGAFRAREHGVATDILPLVAEVQATGGASSVPLMATLFRASLLARFNEPSAARRVLGGLTEGLPGFVSWPSALLEYADVVTRLGDRERVAQLLPLLHRCPWPAVGWGIVGFIWQGPTRVWEGSALRVLERWDEAVAALDDALETVEL